MAATDACVSASDSPASSFTPSREGPVLSVLSKRLRALKKKYNKILQIEESKSQGKPINKEQEEVLKSKLAVAVLIEEYEKLRQPLSVAVKEELTEWGKELMSTNTQRHSEQEEEERQQKQQQPQPQNEAVVFADEKDKEVIKQLVSAEETEQKGTYPLSISDRDPESFQGSVCNVVSEQASSDALDRYISELLTFIYFAQLFDVRSQADTSHLFWTKFHERSSCLSYDCVTEDTLRPLTDADLDDLSLFGLMITSRSPGLTLSHKDALQQCVKHAKLWLQSAENPIMEGLETTYSHLKERLNRILSSEYYTMTPELQVVSQQAAATSAMPYTSRIFIHEASNTDGVMELKDAASAFYPQQQELGSDQLMLYRGDEAQPSTITIEPSGSVSEENEMVQDARGQPSSEIVQQEEVTTSENFQLQEPPLKSEQQQSDAQVPSVSPRGYQGPKAGGRGYPGSGGRGRGRGNHRGGVRGGYGNGGGRGGQYYDQVGYQPRNYYGRGGGRGGRGGYTAYTGNGNGHTSRAANMPSDV